jgi:hypothetical protein
MVAKDAERRVRKLHGIKKTRDLLKKNKHSDSLKKSKFTLSEWMLKKGNVVSDADDDDEVRTSALQNRVTATVCTEEVFLRTQYIYIAFP